MKYRAAFKHYLKKVWVFFGLLFVLFAILFSIFRALTPLVKQYKPEVEHQLSQVLGQPVNIGDLETGWYWFQPVLKMDDVRLSDAHDQALVFPQLQVGINL